MKVGGMSSFEATSRMGTGGGGPGELGSWQGLFVLFRNVGEAAPMGYFALEKAMQSGIFGAGSLEEGFLAKLLRVRAANNPIAAVIWDLFEERGEGRLGITGEEFEQARSAAGVIHDVHDGGSGDVSGGATGSGSNRPFDSIPSMPDGVSGGQDVDMAFLGAIAPTPTVGKGKEMGMGMGAGM